MELSNVVNVRYSYEVSNSKGDIVVLFEDGNILTYDTSSLEYPYFYCNTNHITNYNNSKRSMVKDIKIVKKKILTPDGFMEAEVAKVSAKSVKFINKLSAGASYTCEAHVPYIERRLGADGFITFSQEPKRYAYIDIEEVNGEMMIGYEDSIDWEYFPFKTVEEFLIKCSERKITAIIAWNGEGYDFLRMDSRIKKEVKNAFLILRWEMMQKFDSMLLYAKYTQSTLMSLDKAAKAEGVGRKIVLTKKFEDLTWEELVYYNKNDVDIMRLIVEKSGVLSIPYIISNLTGIRVDKLSPTKIVDNLMMKLGEYLLFDTNPNGKDEDYEGAFTMKPVAGMHHKVAVIDLNHLYPSIVEHMDYTGFRCKDVYYEVRKFIKQFNEMRAKEKDLYKETKVELHNVRQKSYKVLDNSIYGVFANAYYRYHDVDVAEFIAAKGREVRQRMEDVVKGYLYRFINSDTDSGFVDNIEKETALKLVDIINRELYPFEVKLEKYFVSMINMIGAGGKEVKKRYVGLTDEGEILYTGIETVRGEYPDITKQIEERVIEMILKENKGEAEVKTYLEDEYSKFGQKPFIDFVQSKVVDLDREYKSNTTVVKVFRSLNKKVIEIDVTKQLKGKTVDAVGYKLEGDGDEKLVEVSYILTEKNEPIGIDPTLPLADYEQYINRDFYWDKFVGRPLNKIFVSLGWNELETKYVKPKKIRKSATKKTTP